MSKDDEDDFTAPTNENVDEAGPKNNKVGQDTCIVVNALISYIHRLILLISFEKLLLTRINTMTIDQR